MSSLFNFYILIILIFIYANLQSTSLEVSSIFLQNETVYEELDKYNLLIDHYSKEKEKDLYDIPPFQRIVGVRLNNGEFYSGIIIFEYQLSERPFSWSIPRSFVEYDIHGIKGNNSEPFEPIYFYYGWYLINDVIIKMEHLRSIYENTTLLELPSKIPANICAQAERYNKEEHLAIKYGLRKNDFRREFGHTLILPPQSSIHTNNSNLWFGAIRIDSGIQESFHMECFFLQEWGSITLFSLRCNDQDKPMKERQQIIATYFNIHPLQVTIKDKYKELNNKDMVKKSLSFKETSDSFTCQIKIRGSIDELKKIKQMLKK